MDLTSVVVGFQQAQTLGSVQIAVAKKILDNDRDQGNAAVQLIQAAAQTATRASDDLVAAATGLGAQIDTRA